MRSLLFLGPNLVNVGMQDLSHGGSIHGDRNQDMGRDMPVAICVGGPALDLISALMRLPEQAIDAWDKLGGFLGGPAKVVKCETNDLTVPANAEIVLKGRVLTSEGRVHDEGGYAEWTGTYGGGLPHNWNMVVDCITFRGDAIYQQASIGGLHPGRTDTSNVCAAAVEGELYMTLRHVGLHVLDVHVPEATCAEVAYARIKPRSGGDAKRALGTMLSACRQVGPKLAYVFDEDVDIFDDERVKWAQAWRYNPGTDTILIPGQYVSPLDPSITQTHFPFSITKIGFDCTIPLGGDRGKFVAATVSPPIDQPASVKPLDEAALVEQMTAFIKKAPRTWYEILQHFAGQPYPPVYRAFGKLRPKLGRRVDLVPAFPYTFADTEFVQGDGRPK